MQSADDASEIIERLVRHSVRCNLIARAEEGCRQWFTAPGELYYPLASIRMQFASQALFFYNALLPYPYIETRLRLWVGEQEVGHYRLLTRLDGQVDGDYLVIDPPSADLDRVL